MRIHEPHCAKNDAEGNVCTCSQTAKTSTDVDKCKGNNLPVNAGNQSNGQHTAAMSQTAQKGENVMTDEATKLLNNLSDALDAALANTEVAAYLPDSIGELQNALNSALGGC